MITNFPNGVSSYGIPLFGSLFPTGGKVYFADPGNTTGKASSGGDGSLDNPCSTVVAAYNKCTSGKNDIVVFLGDGGTTASERLASTLTWSKNATHLIGITAPTRIAQRCRFTGESTGATFTPLITVSGSGCIFANFSMFHDYGVDPVCINITGDRNYFYNVHFGGMGVTAGGADEAACSVYLNGSDENTFEKCVFGLDTIVRDAANAELEIVGGSKRNQFIDCDFISFAGSSGAGHLFVKIDGSGDMDRVAFFKGCTFYNAIESTATAMTQAFDHHNTSGGMVILDSRCLLIGATDWCKADNGNVYTTAVVPTAGTSGIAIAVTR